MQKDAGYVRNLKVKMVVKMVVRESSIVVIVASQLHHYEVPVYVTSAMQEQGLEMLMRILISVRPWNTWNQHILIEIERCVLLILSLFIVGGLAKYSWICSHQRSKCMFRCEL